MALRKYGISLAAAALLSGAAALLGGCAAERAVLTADSGLTGEALRDEGLAVVGVTVVEEVEQVRPPLITTLEGALRESRPDLAFQSAGEVRHSLGLSAYRRILSAYQSAGKLAESDLQALATTLRGKARFALLARVEKDVIRQPPRRRSQVDRMLETSPSFGIVASSRDARVRVTLYDLAGGREAWAAVYASSSDNAFPDSVSPEPERPLLRRSGGEKDQPGDLLPETPSLAHALIEGFRAFAADLPRVGQPAAPAP